MMNTTSFSILAGLCGIRAIVTMAKSTNGNRYLHEGNIAVSGNVCDCRRCRMASSRTKTTGAWKCHTANIKI